MTKKHTIRAIQLDLARQMETIVFIKQFVDFIAEHHFNTLVLYLEARIKTDSFPFPSDKETYSKDEIRVIVAYCTQKGIDVIPVIGTLGHAELFLQYEEMEKLAELRGGIKGRFSTFRDMFCPSLPKTYQFLESYLSEISTLFPSDFLHVGCDESWDIGFCSLCKEHPGGEKELFKTHLLSIHSIVKSKLRKRMMMWDDMFEVYPDILKDIPKDIVMCTWHYGVIDETPVGHFNNSRKEDPLELYASLGFDSLFCSGANSPRNIETLTEYANSRKALGGLATTWEQNTSFLYIYFPVIAYVGHLWNGAGQDYSSLFSSIMKKMFQGCSDNYSAAYKTLQDMGSPGLRSNLIDYLPKTLNNKEFTQQELFRHLKHELENIPENLTELTSLIVEDLQVKLLSIELGFLLKEVVPSFFTPSFTEHKTSYQNRLKELISLAKEIQSLRNNQWEKHRPGLPSAQLDGYWNNILNSLKQLLSRENVPDMLHVDLFLPEAYSLQSAKISIQYTDGTQYMVVNKVLKPADLSTTYFSRSFVIDANGRKPDSILVEASGFGGIGITYMSIITEDNKYIPEAITAVKGIVEHPARLLTNDQQWCYLGEKDTAFAMKSKSIPENIHMIKIKLTQAN